MASSNGGGKPLGGLARAYQSLQSAVYQRPKTTIDGNNPSGWPSALNPVAPSGPAGSKPLAFSYWQGINLDITPRADLPLNFNQLRDLGTYSLARICIENVKDIVTNFKWKVQLKRVAGEPLEDWKGRQKSQKNDPSIKFLTEFWERPDGLTSWADWWRPIIEDLLVIDAPSILTEKTLSGKLLRLRWTDGSDILRAITDDGRTPEGDNPAYTQLWEGIPRLLLTTDQLIYRPSNIVPRVPYFSKLYGMSITEQLAQDIVIGQARLDFIQAYYKDGITGGMIHVVPSGIGPDQVSENQQSMNALMAGNLAQRRRWNIVQGYMPRDGDREEQIIQTKEPVLADAFDDVHIKKVFFGYGVSSQRISKQMNRASAESSQDASEREGIMPRLTWLKNTVDFINAIHHKMPQYEIAFDTDDELDATKQAEVDKIYVSTGIKTIDEVRDDRGMPPFNLNETKAPIIILATGAVPLEGSIDRVQQEMDNATTAANKPTPAPVANPKPAASTGKQAANGWYNSRY